MSDEFLRRLLAHIEELEEQIHSEWAWGEIEWSEVHDELKRLLEGSCQSES